MSWKGVVSSPSWRNDVIRGIQVSVSALALTVLIFLTRSEVPELALTFYFLYAGPIVVAAYAWGKEVAGLMILAAFSFFVPVMLGTVANTGDGSIQLSWQAVPGELAGVFAIRVLELVASVVLFGSLAVVGERAGAHRRQKDRYRQLDEVGERLSRELQVEELLQVILDQTVPLFRAGGGEIVLIDEQTSQLEVTAAVGVSRNAQQYLQRRAYLETTRVLTSEMATRERLADLILRRNEPFLHNHLEYDPRYVYCDGDTPLLRVRVHSVLAVPLRRGREPFGLLGLFNKSNGGFDQSDVDLLTDIAEKSAVALENARLYHMTDANLAQRVNELSALNRSAHTLASSLDLNQTIQAVLDALQELFPFAIAEVCLWEPVNQVLRTYAWSGDSDYVEASGGIYRLDEGYSGWIARHREQLWIPDVQACQYVRPKVDSAEFPIRSYVGLPLQVGQQLIGSLEMVSYELDAFPTSTKSLLEALCNQAAVAIQNARLYQERQQRLAELAGLQQIYQAISSMRDVDQVYSVLTERIAQLMNVELCGVLLYDPEAEVLVGRLPFYGVPSELIDSYRIPMPQSSPMRAVWEDAAYWYINDVQTNPVTAEFGLTVLASAMDVRATMFAVLAAGYRRLGIIQVSNKRDGSPFDESDARLLSIFAHQATVVLDNARLYEIEQNRRRAMEALQSSATAMSSALDLGAAVRTVVDRAAVTFRADAVSIMMSDRWGQPLVIEASHGLSDGFVATYRLPRNQIMNELEQYGTRPRLFEAPGIEDIVPADLVRSEGLSWAIIVPQMSGGEPLGTLHFYGRGNTQPFTADEMEMVILFANQAAVTIENARLYTHTDERLRLRLNELTVLSRIGHELNATLDLEHILNLVLKEAVQATGASHGNVNLMNWETGALEARAAYGLDSEELVQQEITAVLGRGIISRAAQTAQPIVVDDVTEDPDCVALVPATRSELAMPILHRSIVVGVISLESPRVGGFTEAHIGFLEALAAQAAVALANARSYEEQEERAELLRRRAEQLSQLFELSQTMRTDRPLEHVLTEVAFAVQETVGYNVALISVREGNQQRRIAAAGIPIADFERVKQVRQPWSDLEAVFQEEFRISNSYYFPFERNEVTRHLDTLQLETDDFERETGRWHSEDLLIVPLRGSGDTIMGILSVDQPRDGKVPDRMTVEILEIFAAQAALAVENTRLVDDLKRRVDELTLFNEVGRSLSARLDLEGLSGTIADAAAELLSAPRSVLFLHDPSGRRTVFVPCSAHGYDLAQLESFRFRAGEGLVGTVVETTKAIVVPDAREDERFQPFVPTQNLADLVELHETADDDLGDLRGGSIILVPLIFGGRVIGVISVDHPRPFAFSSADIAILSTLADQAAIAVENARLFEEVRSYRDELELRVEERTEALEKERDRVETLYRITSELGTSLDLDRVLNRTLSLVLDAVKADRGSVFMLDQQMDRLVHKAALWAESQDPAQDTHEILPPGGVLTDFRRGKGLAGWIMEMKRSAIVDDITRDPRWVDLEEREPQYCSVLAVPLIVSDEAMGALLLFHSEPSYFNQDHRRLVEAAAAQVASAINNAELYRYVRDSADRLGRMIKSQQVETAKTEAILEGVADGVMVTDADGAVIRFSAATERILNTPRDQVLGRSTDELLGLYGASGAAWAKAIAEWKVSPPRLGEEALLTERLNFEDRIVSVLFSPVVMNDEFLGTVSLFRDITQEVEVEKTKSEFVSTVSHELRTPMTSIKGYVDLLLLGAAGQLSDNQERFLSIIKTNADRLTMLVDDLLDIGRIDSDRIELSFTEVELSYVVDVVIDSLKGRALDKKQILGVDIPAGLPCVVADRGRLIQILMNLVSNAQQYTPTGGHITLTASLQGELESETRAKMIQVDVSDDGIGIAPEDQEKIFERFFRSDHSLVQETAGTGLGLYITQSLVAMHGGRLWVESELGNGSTFSFNVPVAERVEDSTFDVVLETQPSDGGLLASVDD